MTPLPSRVQVLCMAKDSNWQINETTFPPSHTLPQHTYHHSTHTTTAHHTHAYSTKAANELDFVRIIGFFKHSGGFNNLDMCTAVEA